MGGGCLRRFGSIVRSSVFGQLGRLDLVGLGQDQVIADRGLVEHLHHLAVDVLEAVAGVDQHQRALQHLPAAQIIVDQVAPALDQSFGALAKP